MNAASQRERVGLSGDVDEIVTPARRRGPHPLPVFLAHIANSCAGDPDRLNRALAGLRRYQTAPLEPMRDRGEIVAQCGGVTLRDHGRGSGRPVVLVPSLINPPDVLDLAPGNSFAASLAAAGHRPLIVDWGATEAHGLEAAITERLLPLVRTLGTPVAIIGYCLGGTLALAATALLGDSITRLGLLATPWHFHGYDAAARTGLAEWWTAAAPLAAQLGSVPIDFLQPAFWALDPDGLAEKFIRFGASDGPSEAFVRLEDWANGGAPLSIAATQGLAETLFANDASGKGRWIVGGSRIDPRALTCPILDIVAMRDRIVPPATALTSEGPGTTWRIDAGHVGMVVGGRAAQTLWHPLAKWLHG